MKIEYSRNTLRLSGDKESFSAKIYTPFDKSYLESELRKKLWYDVSKIDIALNNIDQILEVASNKDNWSKKNREYFKIYQAVKEIKSPDIQETLNNVLLGHDFLIDKYFKLGPEGHNLKVTGLRWWLTTLDLDVAFPDRLELFYHELIRLDIGLLNLPAAAFIFDLVKESERLMDIIHGKKRKSKDFA